TYGRPPERHWLRRADAGDRPGIPSGEKAPCLAWRRSAPGCDEVFRRRAPGEQVMGDRLDLGVALGQVVLAVVVGQTVKPRHPRIGPEGVRVLDPLEYPILRDLGCDMAEIGADRSLVGQVGSERTLAADGVAPRAAILHDPPVA